MFKNEIGDYSKFQYTNKLWNDLKLNTVWSVGSVSSIIESKKFCSKEEWRDYYYQLGANRLNKVSSLPPHLQQRLLQLEGNKNLSFKEAEELKPYKYININLGRTEQELEDKACILYAEIIKQGNPLKISLEECVYMVKFRVIAETWNGVIMREKNTIEVLEKKYPLITFKKVNGDMDALYAVDYELYIKDTLICGLQIKPNTYRTSSNEAMKDSYKLNIEKNTLYTSRFNRPVLYAYSKTTGQILNPEVFNEIKAQIDAYFLYRLFDYSLFNIDFDFKLILS